MITQRHKEVRDAFSDLAFLVYHESVVHEASDANNDTLIADLCVRGVWQPQCDAIFDICVLDTDAKAYLDQSSVAVIKTDKKTKYQEACLAQLANFTHFVRYLMAC